MKKLIIEPDKLYCVSCGDSFSEHNKMNRKHWDRLHKQLNGYKDTIKNRGKFWLKFLKNSSYDEWSCSQCDCDEFKPDNLKYLEEKYNERIK